MGEWVNGELTQSGKYKALVCEIRDQRHVTKIRSQGSRPTLNNQLPESGPVPACSFVRLSAQPQPQPQRRELEDQTNRQKRKQKQESALVFVSTEALSLGSC